MDDTKAPNPPVAPAASAAEEAAPVALDAYLAAFRIDPPRYQAGATFYGVA